MSRVSVAKSVARSLGSAKFALDEELWFGGGVDTEGEARAAASLAAVGARIVGAKPFPLAARRLDELTRNTNTRIEQVVSVLESDPALSARLLRLVNSAGYGLKLRCTSVRHAAVLVGSRRLNQVATTAAILDLFDANNSRAVELLEHAAVVGSLCRYLAVHVGLPHDEMFTCGFLHDIGKLMLLDAERERYADILSEFGGAPDQIHVEERRVFGFDHAVLGAHVLAAWNIPDPVPKVIAWHHAPARALQDTVVASMVQTLRLADLLAYVLALHDAKIGPEIAASSEAARYLDISDAQLSAMWQDLAGLRERSRARSHGEPELDAMVPKSEESLRPRLSRVAHRSSTVAQAGRPLQEVPVHFPCGVCGKPSFGNVCAACGRQVCPEHQMPDDEWCTGCRREYSHFRAHSALPLVMKVALGLLVGGTLAVAVVGAANSPAPSLITWLTAPLVVVALWAVVLPVAHRLWHKLRFLQTRRHSLPAAGLAVARASAGLFSEEPPTEIDESYDLSPEERGSGPKVSIGPISTTSMSLSMAPLSMAPPEQPASERPSSSAAPASRSRISPGPFAAAASISPRQVTTISPSLSVAPREPLSVYPRQDTSLAPRRGAAPARQPASMAPPRVLSVPAAAAASAAVPELASEPESRVPTTVPSEEVGQQLSESGAHVVVSRHPPAVLAVNSALSGPSAVRCSALALNACVPMPGLAAAAGDCAPASHRSAAGS